MGSSVWHGGFSTFVAIIVLWPSQTYVFVVFFRTWLCIIFFGLANGFMLLPVILSYVGPTYSVDDPLANDDAPETDDERVENKVIDSSIFETPVATPAETPLSSPRALDGTVDNNATNLTLLDPDTIFNVKEENVCDSDRKANYESNEKS